MPIILDHQLREHIPHTSLEFPITYYHDELITLPDRTGPLHWHPDFEIATAEDMYNFAYWYSKTADKSSYFTVTLSANIDMSNVVDSNGNTLTYCPIEGFYGSFDGEGHIIKNLTISQSNQRTCEFGLFKSIYGDSENPCEVKNLYLSDCKINIVNCCYARTDNYLNELYVGGITGYASYTKFINVQIVGNSEIKESSVSSVIYPILNNSPKTNEKNNSLLALLDRQSVSALNSNYASLRDITEYGVYFRYIGGIVGRADGCCFNTCYSTVKIDVESNDLKLKMNNNGYVDKLSCVKEYGILNNVYAGGLVAYSYDSDFSLCEYSGKLYAHGVTKTVAGGIFGIVKDNNNQSNLIENCCNNGEITGDVDYYNKSSGYDNYFFTVSDEGYINDFDGYSKHTDSGGEEFYGYYGGVSLFGKVTSCVSRIGPIESGITCKK